MAGGTFAVSEGAGLARKRLYGVVLMTLAASVVGFALCASSAQALSPSVGSKAASNVDYSTATLNGTVNPNGLETKTYFEYGPTAAYGSKTEEVSVGSGSSALETAKAVSGLTPNTTYHYRVVATNADGTSTGGDRTFTVGWSVQAPAATSGTSVFEDVSCSSATECTAVGWSGSEAIAQRWNGTEWKAQTPAKAAGSTEAVLQGVSCASSTACTAVGRYKNSSSKWVTLVEAWDGSEWKVQSSPNPSSTMAELEDVSCSAATECTAVGTYWNSGPPETSQTLAMRWNGTEWKIQTTPNPVSNSVELTSVACPSSAFCMSTGYYYDSANSKWVPLSVRWNGTEWTLKNGVQPAGATMSWFFGVSCTSSTTCTAVGDKEINAGTHEHQTMAQRWNGSEWTLQTTPNPEASNRRVDAVSCVSSTECTAVGSFYKGSGYTPMALRWSGGAWTLQTLPLPSGSTGANTYSFGVSCILARGCQMVGQYTNSSSVIVPLAEANWRKAAPTATTTAATSIGEKTATVNGTVNPNGSETKAYFEYGTTLSLGAKTAEVNLGSGSSAVETSAALSGLSPATTYYYRVVAGNENPETSRGSILSFRTTGPPTVSTLSAEVDNATGEAATLRGQVNPNGLSATYQFEYGTSPGVYTNTVPVSPESAGSGTESKLVTYKATGLTRGKTYYYRITASNSAGKSNGFEASFTTPNLPGATTSSASEVTRKCATLQGFVQPNKLATKYWFEYGPTTSYGTKIPVTAKEVSGETTLKAVEETACGLTSNTLYHYRLVTQNGLGTTNGSDQTFTTLAVVTLNVKGTPLKPGAPLKVFSSNFTFISNTEATHSCAETEFSGEVSENPGALEAVTAPKMQNAAGANCTYLPGASMTIKYSFPSAMNLEYTLNKAEEGIVKTGEFTFVGTLYIGLFKVGECEYKAQLSGTYKFKAALESKLSGGSELVKSTTGYCFAAETMSGNFTVTSSGSAVEATH